MKPQSLFSRSLLATAIATSLPAFATTTDKPELSNDALVVYGSTYRNTATKSALAPEETPQGISVVDQQTLEMRNADSIAEALRYVPGVNTELRGGAVTRLDLFNIRGFINYQNAYDGLQLLYNDWNLQPQIDAIAVEQVEVFKGPTSTLYGSMAPGGMVNLIGKSPRQEDYNAVQLAVGTNALTEGSIESRGQIGDSDFSYSFVGLARGSDGQAVTSEEERLVLAPSIDWQLSDRTLVNVNLYYQKDPDMGVYNALPAAGLFKSNVNGKLSTDAFAGDANWDSYEREVTLFGYKINHQFNDNWTFLHNTRFMDGDAYQQNTYNLGLAADQRTLSRRAYLTDEQSRGITMDNQLAGRIQLGATEHNLLFGIEYLKLTSDIRYEDAAAPSLDLFSPDYRLIDPTALDFAASGYSSDFTLKKEQLGFYLQDQIRIDNLVLLAGGRYDRYEGSESGRKYGFPTDTEVEQNQFSGRLGALYEFDNGIAPFVSYAESFEPLVGSDRNGNEFDPSTARQWEAGIKYLSADDATELTVAAFRIDKENVPTRDPNGGPYDQIQAGEVRSQGLELDLRHQFSDNLLMTAAWTLQDVEVTRDNNGLQGKTPVWTPDQLLSVWANYDVSAGTLAGTTLGLGVRYIGEAELNAANTEKVPSATLVDLSVRYPLSKNSTLRLAANNLFDKRYYSCFDDNNCWFGAERSVEASFRYEF